MEKEGRASSQLHYGNYYKGDEAKPVHSRFECSPDVDKTQSALSATHRRASTPTVAKLL
jgi:hypothetical protein